jgi:hypothetical protein
MARVPTDRPSSGAEAHEQFTYIGKAHWQVSVVCFSLTFIVAVSIFVLRASSEQFAMGVSLRARVIFRTPRTARRMEFYVANEAHPLLLISNPCLSKRIFITCKRAAALHAHPCTTHTSVRHSHRNAGCIQVASTLCHIARNVFSKVSSARPLAR